MNSYNKQALDIIAKEQGFIRDNLEKVMRLVEILNYFHDSPLLSKSLVLKGGTAINLTIFQLPRLSVDIDLEQYKNVMLNNMAKEMFSLEPDKAKMMRRITRALISEYGRNIVKKIRGDKREKDNGI